MSHVKLRIQFVKDKEDGSPAFVDHTCESFIVKDGVLSVYPMYWPDTAETATHYPLEQVLKWTEERKR